MTTIIVIMALVYAFRIAPVLCTYLAGLALCPMYPAAGIIVICAAVYFHSFRLGC